MKRRDLYLTGILLVLVGILLGTVFALYTVNKELAPLSEVRFTEVMKGDSPVYEDEELAGLDARFLFKNIAEVVTPSVVYIETIVPLGNEESTRTQDDTNDSFWDRIMPRRARTVGSGVIITSDGYILTNNHVVEDAVKRGIKVVLSDKREYPAEVIGVDPSTDLAVIKVKAQQLKPVVVGNSETVDVGEWVLAIGNPFRLRSTVTAGIVSALSRDVQIINDNFRIESFIQTDAAINKGNSGGALVNTSAQLIGINTAIASQSGSYQGYGFAVPSNLALKVAKDLIEFGEVRRALLGVNIASVDYTRALEVGLETVKGVEIIAVSETGAAYEYGIRRGDIVTAVNGIVVNESNQLQEKIAILSPGDTVNLSIWRKGKEINTTVQLKQMDQAPVAEYIPEEVPVEVDELPEGDNSGVEFHEFGIGFRVMALARPENDKAFDLIVTKVFKYSEAWNRGLREEQKIISIDKVKVEDLATLKELVSRNLTKNGSVSVEIVDADDARGFIELKNK